MVKTINNKQLEGIAARHGFDPVSLQQVLERFERLSATLKKHAILRAIQSQNWGQLDAFICMRSWLSLGVIQTLPEPLAGIPEVAAIWKAEWMKWLLQGAQRGHDRSKKLPLEWQSSDVQHEWLPQWKKVWLGWLERKILKFRDTFQMLPEILRNDPEVQAQRMAFWSAHCNFRCSWSQLKTLPADVRESPAGYLALRQAVLRKLTESMPYNNFEFIELDHRLATDPVVLQKRKTLWLCFLKFRFRQRQEKPEDEMLQDPEVFSAWRSAWLKAYRSRDGYLPTELPRELRGDKEAALEVWRYCWITSRPDWPSAERIWQDPEGSVQAPKMKAACAPIHTCSPSKTEHQAA
ncbi:MAG: hypothetical protein DVB28_001416 [Verrucomicrobia bacterium]|nr:MAG: hypothetical protein DVB28_001416 [Verrucomicrobiota bacterium]